MGRMRTYGGSVLGGGSSAVSAGPIRRLNEEALPRLGLSGVEESPLRSRLRPRSLAPRFPTAYYECARGDAYCSAR
jgi:hypothetical protein